jgi:hypothetical protein
MIWLIATCDDALLFLVCDPCWNSSEGAIPLRESPSDSAAQLREPSDWAASGGRLR